MEKGKMSFGNLFFFYFNVTLNKICVEDNFKKGKTSPNVKNVGLLFLAPGHQPESSGGMG